MNIPQEKIKEAKEICIKEKILNNGEKLYDLGPVRFNEKFNERYNGIMNTFDPNEDNYNRPFLIYDFKNESFIVLDKAFEKKDGVYYIDHYKKKEKKLD